MIISCMVEKSLNLFGIHSTVQTARLDLAPHSQCNVSKNVVIEERCCDVPERAGASFLKRKKIKIKKKVLYFMHTLGCT